MENYDLQSVELIQALKRETDTPEVLAKLSQLEDILASYQFEQALSLLREWTE
ncbi:hypothetical protein JCM19232_3147 [Vibrio ishigakensis]|uniref:Uncharacterized protein n=1 Tax=Vibrio ishigakensis TaxID=1481914 RepID=A0A0B8PQA1_9VIBR|nr:hypothetical protein JCM19232_3147 [Vibrio ishigakensis]GAM70972.1 hypothetical protein JCM19236_1139 [Vibrio sp. JCM 19236]